MIFFMHTYLNNAPCQWTFCDFKNHLRANIGNSNVKELTLNLFIHYLPHTVMTCHFINSSFNTQKIDKQLIF